MTTEEEIKKRMLQQRMQEQMMYQQAAMQEQAQVQQALEMIMSRILDKKAKERLSNLKLVKPDLAAQLELYLAQLFQAGQIKGIITDDQLVMILKKITEKRDIRIKRK
ncbi:MAG: DNA-binding protein [Candidatus Aenigmarchaeota archaeon]|nr:DNA-binding protein [Candidatus Aenigmarchaeota archaeon]MDI6722719.1 DNA-binding protein [Candidatus Aenigmarchaeota archaeon]